MKKFHAPVAPASYSGPEDWTNERPRRAWMELHARAADVALEAGENGRGAVAAKRRPRVLIMTVHAEAKFALVWFLGVEPRES